MARINIEASIYSDFRFVALKDKIGDHYKALGLLVSAWALAQKHFLSEESSRFIPFNEWKLSPFHVLIDVGLAVENEKGVYVCGSNDQFSWLIQRKNAGKLGGRPKKKGPALFRLTDESGSNPLTLTLTPPPSPLIRRNTCEEFEKGFNPEIENCRDYFNDEYPSITFKKPVWIKIVDRFKDKHGLKVWCDEFMSGDKLSEMPKDDLQRLFASKILEAAGVK